LLLSAAFAALIALKNGYTSAAVADAAIGGLVWKRVRPPAVLPART
jgi:hypothetical protein